MAFTDDFTGTTGQLLENRSGWTLSRDGAKRATIYDNALTHRAGGGGSGRSVWTCTDQGSADHYLKITDADFSQPDLETWAACRLVDYQNFIGWYLAGTGSVGSRLCKMVSNVLTDLVQFQGALDDVLKIECNGNVIKIYKNGTQQGTHQTVTDHQTETTQGLIANQSFGFGDMTLRDDFEVGPMVVPAVAGWTVNDTGGSTASSITLTKPANVAVGDLLLIIVGSDAGNNPDWLPHTGWTLFVDANGAQADAALGIYWRIATGGEGGSEVIDHNSSAELYGWYLRVTGAHTTTPIHVTGTPQADVPSPSTTHIINEITTTKDNCLIFYALAFDGGDGAPFSVAGTGWGEIDEQTSGTGANDACGCWGIKDQPTAGLTGDATVTTSIGDGSTRVQFAVAPAAIEYTIIAAAGSFAMNGVAVDLKHDKKIDVAPDSFAWTGQPVNLELDRLILMGVDSFAWTGYDVTLTKTVEYSLDIGPGSFALSGQIVNLLYDHRIDMAPSSYIQTGQPVNLEYNRIVSVSPGAYGFSLYGADLIYTENKKVVASAAAFVMTGQTVNLLKDRRIDVGPGAYTETGQIVNLLKDWKLVISPDSFVWTGYDVTLTKTGGYTLIASPGAFAWTGQAVNLEYDRIIILQPGSYAQTGQIVNLLKDRRLDIGPGAFTWTGSDVSLLYGYGISAEPGSYILTGQDVALKYDRFFDIGAGSFALSGQSVDLLKDSSVPMGAGTYAMSGQIANLLKDSSVIIAPGSYAFSGQDVEFLRDRVIIASPGAYTYQGYQIYFIKGFAIVAAPGSFIMDGKSVALALVKFATGAQASREEKDLLLIDGKKPVFIGGEKPIFISEDID